MRDSAKFGVIAIGFAGALFGSATIPTPTPELENNQTAMVVVLAAISTVTASAAAGWNKAIEDNNRQ
jgi:hypothetical protein